MKQGIGGNTIVHSDIYGAVHIRYLLNDIKTITLNLMTDIGKYEKVIISHNGIAETMSRLRLTYTYGNGPQGYQFISLGFNNKVQLTNGNFVEAKDLKASNNIKGSPGLMVLSNELLLPPNIDKISMKNIMIHINKPIMIGGEGIFFKTYVGNDNE